MVTKNTFVRHGRAIMGRTSGTGRQLSAETDFRRFFGLSPALCVYLWWVCSFEYDGEVTPARLLWALMFLKVYATEPVLSALAGVTRKTYRKWVWRTIRKIARRAPHIIKWSNRYRNDKGKTCLTTVDTSDFACHEPVLAANKRFSKKDKAGRWLTCDPKWFSHKFKGPAVRYEMAVCIQTGDIVWIKGPFPAGRWSDPKIFKSFLMQKLDDDEMVEADGVYKGMPFDIRKPGDYLNEADQIAKAMARARQETLFRRVKQYNVLGKRFRHGLKRHKECFQAVAVLTQIGIESGEVPFQIRY